MGAKANNIVLKKFDHKLYQFEEFAATTIGTRFFLQSY
jgi:hypothetical protein